MTIQTSEGFGLHLTLDGYGGHKEKLADLKLVKRVLFRLPQILQLRKISPIYTLWYGGGKDPADCGVSGFVMIAESHISIHTFSEKGFLTADVYSCKSFDTGKTIEFFRKEFDLSELEINIAKRGLKFPRSFSNRPQPQPQTAPTTP